MDVFEKSIGPMRYCSILLMNHSIHFHFSILPQCRDEFSAHYFNASCISVYSQLLNVHKHSRMFIVRYYRIRPNEQETLYTELMEH